MKQFIGQVNVFRAMRNILTSVQKFPTPPATEAEIKETCEDARAGALAQAKRQLQQGADDSSKALRTATQKATHKLILFRPARLQPYSRQQGWDWSVLVYELELVKAKSISKCAPMRAAVI